MILVIPLPIFNENIKEIKLSTLATICSIFTNRRSYNTISIFFYFKRVAYLRSVVFQERCIFQ